MTSIGDPMLLPPDIAIIPGSDLDELTREKCVCRPEDYVLSRPSSRLPSSVVNKAAADLLGAFRTPKTIVEVALSLYFTNGGDPEIILDQVFEVLRPFIAGRWLVPSVGPDAPEVEPLVSVGATFGRDLVVSQVQSLEDTEVYQLKGNDGRLAALKIARREVAQQLAAQFRHEAKILAHVGGASAARLIESGVEGGCPFILTEWSAGVWATKAADDLRGTHGLGAEPSLLQLCINIAKAFEAIHASGVVHGDVYPKNVLIDAKGGVTIVDFGLARFNEATQRVDAGRGGVPDYFEPELAEQILAGRPRCAASVAGEQYALGAMFFLIMTGSPYLSLSPRRDAALSQIVEEGPRRFMDCGVREWTGLERVLARALSKAPADRYRDLGAFREALEAVLEERPPAKPSRRHLLDRFDFGSLVPHMALPAGVPQCSLSFGASGIAYALYCASAIQQDARLLAMADAWSWRAEAQLGAQDAFISTSLGVDEASIGQGSVWFGAPGVFLTKALVSQAIGDQPAAMNAVRSYCDACASSVTSNDLTIGRAGQLLGCVLLLDALGHFAGDAESPASLTMALGTRLFLVVQTHMKKSLDEYRYLGVAHGIAGELYALLLWCEVSGASVPDALRLRVRELASVGLEHGRGLRFPLNRRPQSSFMESWCHGMPGYVHLWSAAHRTLRDAVYVDLVEKAAWTVWDSDSLGDTLCCGDAGKAYSLLSAYRTTGSSEWLARADELAYSAIRATRSGSDLVNALYKGALGSQLLLCDLASPHEATMPLFERDSRSGTRRTLG